MVRGTYYTETRLHGVGGRIYGSPEVARGKKPDQRKGNAYLEGKSVTTNLGSVNGQACQLDKSPSAGRCEKKGTAPPALRSPLYSAAYYYYRIQPLRHVFVTSRSRPSEVIVGFRYAFFIPVPPIGLISVCDTPDTPMLQSACNPAASRLRTEKSLKMDL